MSKQRHNTFLDLIKLLEDLFEAKTPEGDLVYDYHTMGEKVLQLLEDKNVVKFSDDKNVESEVAAENENAAKSTLTDEEAESPEDDLQGKTSKR